MVPWENLMSEHIQRIPADKKDREKFSKEWRANRDFKESEKTRRFAEIEERRSKNRNKGSREGINIGVLED